MELEDPLLSSEDVVMVPQFTDHGGVVCDDPPLSLASGGWPAPSLPLNSPPRGEAERDGVELLTPPPLNKLSSSQLKAVSVKKLSMKKLHLGKTKYSRMCPESTNLTRPNEVHVTAEVHECGELAKCDDVRIDLTSPTPSTSPTTLAVEPTILRHTSSHDAPANLQDCASTPAQKTTESPSHQQQPLDVSDATLGGMKIHSSALGKDPGHTNTPEVVPCRGNNPSPVPDCDNTPQMVPDCANTPEMIIPSCTSTSKPKAAPGPQVDAKVTGPGTPSSHPPTPSLSRSSQTAGGMRSVLGLSRTVNAPSSGASIAADSDTPPLARTHPVARARNNARLPASDCTKVEEGTKSTRRKLSLSYSRKRGPQSSSNKALPPAAQKRRLSICDETIEIDPIVPRSGCIMSDASTGKAPQARDLPVPRPPQSLNKDRSKSSGLARNADTPPVKSSKTAAATASSLLKDTSGGSIPVGSIPESHLPPVKVTDAPANVSGSPLTACAMPGNQAKDKAIGSAAAAILSAHIKDSAGVGSSPSGKLQSGGLENLPVAAASEKLASLQASRAGDVIHHTASSKPSKLAAETPVTVKGADSNQDVEGKLAGDVTSGVQKANEDSISRQRSPPGPNAQLPLSAPSPSRRGEASGKDHVVSAAGLPNKKQIPAAPSPNQRGGANNMVSTAGSLRPNKKKTFPATGKLSNVGRSSLHPEAVCPRVLRTPPQLYAHGAWSPADYTKIILSSFDSYFSQLAKAQSEVLYRVKWGHPIKSVSSRRWGGAASSFVLHASRKTRSSCPVDEYADLYLKIVPPPDLEKTRPATLGKKPDSFGMQALKIDSGHVTEQNGHVTEQNGHVNEQNDLVTEQSDHVTEQNGCVTEHDGHVTEQSGHVMEWYILDHEADSMDHQAIHDENSECHNSRGVEEQLQMDGDRHPASLVCSQQPFLGDAGREVSQTFLNENPDVLSTLAVPEGEGGGGISPHEGTEASPETILISTTQDRSDVHPSYCEPILISTQGDPTGTGENRDSNGSPVCDSVLVGGRSQDPILCNTQDDPGSGHSGSNRAHESRLRHSTPSSTSSVGGWSAQEAASPWLNSRKPPPSAKKVRKETPSRSKQLSLPKASSSKAKKPSKGGRRGHGKGTAAGRFLRSNAASMSGDDSDSSECAVGVASGSCDRVLRVGSDESSDIDEDRRDTFISPVVRAMTSGDGTSTLGRASISRGGSREASKSRGHLTPSSSRILSTSKPPSTSRGLSTSKPPSTSRGLSTSRAPSTSRGLSASRGSYPSEVQRCVPLEVLRFISIILIREVFVAQ